LAGSGKTTIAGGLEREIFDRGGTAVVLDGSSLRLGLSRELDFSGVGRAEHLRRAAETARLLNDAGLIVIAAFVSPDRDLRRQVREIVGEERFLEVFLDAPVEVCEARDPGEVYRKAREGLIATLPGVTMPYEAPETPDLVVRTVELSAEESVQRLLELLKKKGFFPRPEKE